MGFRCIESNFCFPANFWHSSQVMTVENTLEKMVGQQYPALKILRVVAFQCWCPPQAPLCIYVMTCLELFSSRNFSRIPTISLQYKFCFIMQNFTNFNLRDPTFDFSNSGGHSRCCKKYTPSLYQGEREYCSNTFMFSFPTYIMEASDWVKVWCNSSALQFKYDNNFPRPYPLIRLVVFMCKSYSNILMIHFTLFPSLAG